MQSKKNIENPSQKFILLSDNMFDYIVRLKFGLWKGGAEVLLHTVHWITLLRSLFFTVTLGKWLQH